MSSTGRIPGRVHTTIVGGGPAGLLLARKLAGSGIDCVILERRSRSYVLSRIRAGVLEQGSVDQLREAGLSRRLDCEGLVHDGCVMADDQGHFHLDFAGLVGKAVTVYGQTEVTRDLYDALDADGVPIVHEAENVQIHGVDGDSPNVTFRVGQVDYSIACDYVAGCDGFHGVSRGRIPAKVKQQFRKSFSFGWLGSPFRVSSR